MEAILLLMAGHAQPHIQNVSFTIKQCFGFGYYVHDYLWNANPFPEPKESAAVSFHDGTDVEAYFKSGIVRRGSILRVRDDKHTLAFIG